jgi:hypothetical protein
MILFFCSESDFAVTGPAPPLTSRFTVLRLGHVKVTGRVT